MAGNIQAIKGTKDTLPSESYKSQYIEQAALDTAKTYGFHEMRTPVFEYTELFDRSVGETTDVVQKEMYTFDPKSVGGIDDYTHHLDVMLNSTI